jgi:hypothetical protein
MSVMGLLHILQSWLFLVLTRHPRCTVSGLALIATLAQAKGPRTATEVEKSKVLKMETMEQNTTYMEKGNMALPSVVSLTPTTPHPLDFQRSWYYAQKFGPTLSFGSLENLAGRPYQGDLTSSAEQAGQYQRHRTSSDEGHERNIDVPSFFAQPQNTAPESDAEPGKTATNPDVKNLPAEHESDEESMDAFKEAMEAAESASVP